ncbi:hypothetical protein OH492_08050 [Vibrio chagasii]|nr:hypothetical protein [Vibrio chagasii]
MRKNAFFSEPKHPYTKGLISSFPTIHGPKERSYDPRESSGPTLDTGR